MNGHGNGHETKDQLYGLDKKIRCHQIERENWNGKVFFIRSIGIFYLGLLNFNTDRMYS
jgi:hypothetical protein